VKKSHVSLDKKSKRVAESKVPSDRNNSSVPSPPVENRSS